MINLEELDKAWLSPIVARSEISKFTQGLYKSRSFNSFDANKKGIKRKIKLNNKVAYLKSDVLQWLNSKLKIEKGKSSNDEDVFNKLKKCCPNIFITRKDLKKITGGLICGRTMEKLDHAGKGIKNRKIIGTRTVYHIDDLVTWLKANVEFVNFEEGEK